MGTRLPYGDKKLHDINDYMTYFKVKISLRFEDKTSCGHQETNMSSDVMEIQQALLYLQPSPASSTDVCPIYQHFYVIYSAVTLLRV